jgi:hypothetical protein
VFVRATQQHQRNGRPKSLRQSCWLELATLRRSGRFPGGSRATTDVSHERDATSVDIFASGIDAGQPESKTDRRSQRH